MELGDPGVKFMVALDTGSDLFWVPCDCNRCAPTQGTAFASVLCFLTPMFTFLFILVLALVNVNCFGCRVIAFCR